MIGKTVGHYQVGEQLGRGGMGEVHVADDLNLNRKVALKFLPDSFIGNPERMARFERDAQVLASLNHPGIAAIHGLEEAEGKRFLVLGGKGGTVPLQAVSARRVVELIRTNMHNESHEDPEICLLAGRSCVAGIP